MILSGEKPLTMRSTISRRVGSSSPCGLPLCASDAIAGCILLSTYGRAACHRRRALPAWSRTPVSRPQRRRAKASSAEPPNTSCPSAPRPARAHAAPARSCQPRAEGLPSLRHHAHHRLDQGSAVDQADSRSPQRESVERAPASDEGIKPLTPWGKIRFTCVQSWSCYSGKREASMKTEVAATAALALVLLSIGALISCRKSESPQPARSTGQAAQTSKAEQPPPPQPRAQRLLRRGTHPHQLVGGRLGHWQPHHRT